MARQLGIRALQQHASDAVSRAAAGETIEITDRGRPVAQLVPLRTSGIEHLLAAGLLRARVGRFETYPRRSPAAPSAVSRNCSPRSVMASAEVAYYLDTSAFLKLVVHEDESAALRRALMKAENGLVSSDLLRTEALRAARRHSPAALAQARTLLDGVALLAITADVCERAAELDPSILRGLDALHLASALALGDDLQAVVTYDDRLAEACTAHGVPVLAPR